MKLHFRLLAGAACLMFTVTGCNKKQAAEPVEEAPVEEAAAAPAPEAAPAAPSGPQRLSATEAVRAAMEKRQYQDAVRMVLQLQSSAQTEEQLQEAATLKQEVKLGLMDVAAQDRKAYEALGLLRATTLGR